ncbi:MAG: hypothetical protein IT381_04210 [Deltaproteobacteria bacterium]|nr:hypothetical protein [Deltaproteobacteria bacterium]
MPWLLCALALIAAPKTKKKPKPPAAIMVLYFDNNSGDVEYDPLGKGLADMMITDLSALPDVRVVEREKLQALLAELKLQKGKYFDPKTAQKIGKGVGAEFAVTGSFMAFDPQVRIDVRVVKIETGTVVKASQVVGKKEEFFALQEQLARALTTGLGAALGGRSVKAGAGVDSLATAQSYGKSLDASDQGDLKTAGEELQKVVKAAPEFQLAKTRYMAIMKELYAAKSVRSDALKKAEDELLELMREDIKKTLETDWSDFNWRMRLVRVAVRGELYLKRVADQAAGPASAYAADLQAWLQNQEAMAKLILQIEGERTHRGGNFGLACGANDEKFCITDRELELIDTLQLGIRNDQGTRMDPHQIYQDIVGVMMFGWPPFNTQFKFAKRVCFYKLDKAYPKRAFELLDLAVKALHNYLIHVNGYEQTTIDEEEISLEIMRARAYLEIKEPESAIAALQAMMTKHPKRKEFPQMEAYVRAILDGKFANGKPVHVPCEDPR